MYTNFSTYINEKVNPMNIEDYIPVQSKEDVIHHMTNLFNVEKETKNDEFKELAESAINEFKSTIKIFKTITILWGTGFGKNAIAMYMHTSSLLGEPIVVLFEDTIISELKRLAPDEYHSELSYIIKESIFHELGHAMVDIDNAYVFEGEKNILNFEDEEIFVEDFCREFYGRKQYPKEIDKLTRLFLGKKWIGYDEEYE